MAWIELHQALRKHPKLLHLTSLVGISDKDLVRAKLENLWLEALDYCLNGRLAVAERPLGAAEIADWSGWSGDSALWLRSLIASGWIDEKAGGSGGKTLYLHDWQQYAGKLLARREADRARKPKKGVQRNSNGNPSESGRTYLPEPTVTVPTNQPEEEEPPRPLALASQDAPDEGRELDRSTAAFGFCASPGIEAKKRSISELRRLGISHEFIRAVAKGQPKKAFYTIINEIEKGKAKPEFEPSPAPKPRCRNIKCINGRVADVPNSTPDRTAWKPCPDCGPPLESKATG